METDFTIGETSNNNIIEARGKCFRVDYFGFAETTRTTNIPPNFVDDIVAKFLSVNDYTSSDCGKSQNNRNSVVLVLPEIQIKHLDNGFRRSSSEQAGFICFRRINETTDSFQPFIPLKTTLTIKNTSVGISTVEEPYIDILTHSIHGIVFCSQGITHPEYFGFITTHPPITATNCSTSTTPNSEKFPHSSLSSPLSSANCHVFRCSSEAQVAKVMQALKSAFQMISSSSSLSRSSSPSSSSSSIPHSHQGLLFMNNNRENVGPIERLNRLCKEIQTKSFSEAHGILQKFIEVHHATEHGSILRRIQEAGCETIQEANEIIVSCLLRLAEEKPSCPRPPSSYSSPSSSSSSSYPPQSSSFHPLQPPSPYPPPPSPHCSPSFNSASSFHQPPISTSLLFHPQPSTLRSYHQTPSTSPIPHAPPPSSSQLPPYHMPPPDVLLPLSSSSMSSSLPLSTGSSAFQTCRNNSLVSPPDVRNPNIYRTGMPLIVSKARTENCQQQQLPQQLQQPHQQQQSNATKVIDFVNESRNQFPENSPMRAMFLNVGNNMGKSPTRKMKPTASERPTTKTPQRSNNPASYNNNMYNSSNNKSFAEHRYSSNHHRHHHQHQQQQQQQQHIFLPGSWRLGILNKVVSTSKAGLSSVHYARYLRDLRQTPAMKMNYLWRKAIVDTMVLIKLNRGKSEDDMSDDGPEVTVKEKQVRQMKVDYDEITPCLKEVTKVWEEMLVAASAQSDLRIDWSIIISAVKAGVPRKRRGDIWIFIMQQKLLESSSSPPPSSEKAFEQMNTPYKELLKLWTQHQHAILIDLGRTFPGHPYFSTQLGSGQISLFNILKAYSLLDTEVGYCQGISFVAGILLMHIQEEKSFEILKHMMFKLNFRRQYRPDMVHLQIKLYQLSRLLHDFHGDLYDHFDRHEISPTLYAAPWFLTIFASQFPLGFVARVFDLIFLQGCDVVVKVAIVLLGNHKELIKQCDGFESVVDFLKTTLPEMSIIQMERIINQVFDLDISKKLEAYKIEYHVLREEMLALKASANNNTTNNSATKTTITQPSSTMLSENGVANISGSNNSHFVGNLRGSNGDVDGELRMKVEELKIKNQQLVQHVEELQSKLEAVELSHKSQAVSDRESIALQNVASYNLNMEQQQFPTSNMQKQLVDLFQYSISLETVLNKVEQFLPEELRRDVEKTISTKPKWLSTSLIGDLQQSNLFNNVTNISPSHSQHDLPTSLFFASSLQQNFSSISPPPPHHHSTNPFSSSSSSSAVPYSFWPPSPLSDGGIGCYLDREVEDFINTSINISPTRGGLGDDDDDDDMSKNLNLHHHQQQQYLHNSGHAAPLHQRPSSNYY